MSLRLNKLDTIFVIVSICGFILFANIYSDLFPEASIHLTKDKHDIESISRHLVENQGYSLEGYHSRIDLRHDSDQLQYLERTYPSGQANELMQDSIKVFYWNVQWAKSDANVTQVTVSNETIDSMTEAEQGQYHMMFGLDGRPFYFDYALAKPSLSDSLIIISLEDAKSLVQSFIQSELSIDLTQWQTIRSEMGNDQGKGFYSFAYQRVLHIAGETVTLTFKVAHGKIISYEKKYNLPESYSTDENENEVYEIISFIVVYLLFIILSSIFFVKRLRSDLLDLKSGIVPGLIVFTGFCLTFFLPHANAALWEILLGFIIAAPFVTGALWVVFVLGESYTREIWPDKLQSIDLLRRNWLFPNLGTAVFRGFMLCGIILGVVSLYDACTLRYFDAYFTFGEASVKYWATPVPALYAIGTGLLNSFYIVITYCLFFLAFMRSKIRPTWLFVILMALFFSFISLPLPKLLPFPLRMGANFIVGLIIIFFYLRFDFVTISLGTMLLPIVYYGTASAFAQTNVMQLNAILLWLFILGLLIIGMIAFRRKGVINTEIVYVPDYVQRIYERERIHRELEIARNVQLTFLPNRTPSLESLEVASVCLPAREVGGDYFDFIELGPKKLGVVIGDVSGKGIPAAFYMTLTKGFLRSQARQATSPRQVLVHMNELFYENADRDMFITMIYGIFDLAASTLTVARAGHNPLILKRKDDNVAEEITPEGLALGLEPGELFARTLEEHTIGIGPGDSFFFYTDGFNEAQNRFKEEFGEERLRQSIESCKNLSAESMLAKIQENVAHFMGTAMQHDDMTAVIVKIKDSQVKQKSEE